MQQITLGKEFLEEFESEVEASRKCLERIPDNLYKYKPHEKSMELGYLALLVAEIPKWISSIIETGVVDFATYDHFQLSTTDALVKHFDKNVEDAKKKLASLANEDLSKTFELKNSGNVMWSTPVKVAIYNTINHWVHHRGQLTVYMRLNDIEVPSIYGPSADDRRF